MDKAKKKTKDPLKCINHSVAIKFLMGISSREIVLSNKLSISQVNHTRRNLKAMGFIVGEKRTRKDALELFESFLDTSIENRKALAAQNRRNEVKRKKRKVEKNEAEFIDYVKNGFTCSEIAKLLNLHRNAVYLKMEKLKERGVSLSFTDYSEKKESRRIQDLKFIEYIKQGLSCNQITKLLNINRDAAYYKLKKLRQSGMDIKFQLDTKERIEPKKEMVLNNYQIELKKEEAKKAKEAKKFYLTDSQMLNRDNQEDGETYEGITLLAVEALRGKNKAVAFNKRHGVWTVDRKQINYFAMLKMSGVNTSQVRA